MALPSTLDGVPLEERLLRERVRSRFPLVGLFARRGRRLTEGARRVIVGAREQADALGDPYIGPEHLLLALLDAPKSAAARALALLGVTAKAVRAEVQRHERRSTKAARRQAHFTPESKRVLELSLHEAVELKDDSITAEHLLLAIVRARQNLACEVLERLGVGEAAVRRSVLALREA